jgi:hypothetical protein
VYSFEYSDISNTYFTPHNGDRCCPKSIRRQCCVSRHSCTVIPDNICATMFQLRDSVTLFCKNKLQQRKLLGSTVANSEFQQWHLRTHCCKTGDRRTDMMFFVEAKTRGTPNNGFEVDSIVMIICKHQCLKKKQHLKVRSFRYLRTPMILMFLH